MGLRTPLLLVGVLLLGSRFGSLDGDARPDGSDGASVRLSLDDQANRLWQDIPDGPAASEDEKVRRLGGTPPPCATEALRRAKAAAERAALGRVAVRALEMKVNVAPAMLREQRISGVMQLAWLFDQYVESSDEQDFVRRTGAPEPARAALLYQHFLRSRSDQVLLASPDSTCGVVRLLFDIRTLPEEPGRLYASILVEGNCSCRAPATAPPGAKLGRWRVAGFARMKPDDRSFDEQKRKAEVKWKLDEPRYAVLGICGPCPKDDSEKRAADDLPGQGACSRCGPLEDVARGWEEEAARAEAAAKATQEGPAAAKALTDRAAAARQAAAESRGAYGKCRDDCVLPPPVVAKSEPPPPPPKKSGGGGGKGVLIAGGAAVIGGGTAIALRGSDDSSSSRTANLPPDSTAPTTVTTVPPTTRPDPSTPTPPPTTSPPPPTCPNIFRAFTGRGTTVSNSGCAVNSTWSGTMRISGTCAAAVFDLSEPQGARTYRGTVAANGSFSGTGSGILQGRFNFNGTLTGIVNGPSLNADEALNFTAGCPGQRVVYNFVGS